MRKRTILAVVIVAALLIGSSPIALAQAGQEVEGQDARLFVPVVESGAGNASGQAVVTQKISVAEQEAALALWTRERLAAADAMPLMVQTGPSAADVGVPEEPVLAGPGMQVAPGRAAADADQVARAAYAVDWAMSAASVQDEATLETALAAEAAAMPADATGASQIYTSYIANWLSALQTPYPHRWIGRFSFSTPSGTSYCSATALGGNNIVTAAHCVYDTPSRNAWYTNKVFTPAYRNGSAPYGTFATTACTILTSWVNLSGAYSINSWAKYDVAVCTVGRNSAGQTLNTAVGYSGYAWNYGYVRNVDNLGYPLKNYAGSWLSWRGAYLRLCAAETYYRSTDVRGMGCNWGGGISGGPWIDSASLASPVTYGTNGYWPGRVSGYVTTVNSGIDGSTQNLYGIRFTNSNITTLCNARGC